MPSHVRGPFIEYECSRCGRRVQENADVARDKLRDRIAEANNDRTKRLCAGCDNPQTCCM
jgi:hypothetical protein